MPAEVHVLIGEDDYSLKEAFRALRDSAVPGELWESNGVLLDGQKLAPQELQTYGATYPFLAPKRMVVVEGLLSRFEDAFGRRRRGPSNVGASPTLKQWSNLPELLLGLPSTTMAVFLDGRVSRENRLLQLLRPAASVREFPTLRGGNLARWVRQRANSLGLPLSPPAMSLLIDLVGGNLWAMSAELEKLSTYGKDGPIGEEEVRQLVAQAREVNVFNMLDSLLAGQRALALSQLQLLLTQGEHPGRILTVLAQQLRLLLQVRGLQDNAIPEEEMPSVLGVNEFRLKRAREQISDLRGLDLVKAYEKLLETDLKIKTGVYPDDLALFLLLERLWEN